MAGHTAPDSRFGVRLRELRIARGLSLRGLASKVPCKHPHISDMESGRRNPSQATAARLDKVLDAEGELIALAVAESSEQRDFAEPVATHKIVSRQLAYLRADAAALEIVDLARLSWRHLPPLGRCVIGIVEARALGRIGDRQGCQRAVGVCDEHFAVCTSASADDPAWSYYADEGQVLGDAGHALFDLAMATGDQLIGSATIDRLETAYTTHPLDAHRSRALTMIRIACLKARFGDPEEACSAAESGISDARQVSSRRITDDLRILDASLSDIPMTGETFDHVAKVRVDVQQLANVGS